MKVKVIIEEDFVNYKKPSMLIGFPSCTFKCEREAKISCCQNGPLASVPDMEVDVGSLVERYLNNPLTAAVVLGGLEPLDSFEDVRYLIAVLRGSGCKDDVVLYTGYTEEELPEEYLRYLQGVGNIIVKFGRYKPNAEKHFDKVLGVWLRSPNQYARMIS